VLDIERRSGIAVITMNHGKVNALDLELLRAVTAAVRDCEDASALVLTGTGRAFSAGVDLRRISAGGAEYVGQFLPALSETFTTIFDHPRPVIGAVNGHAIAGGCVIAAACDLRLMSQGTIGLAELTVGVPFPTSALEIMRHAVGPFARRMVFTGQLLDAHAAEAVGLVDSVLPPDELLDAAVQRAGVLARIPADVFALSKLQLRRPARERIATNGPVDDETVTALWASAEVQTAIADYVDRLGRGSAPS
jgi:enoyl-CoA hydratase